MSFEEKVLKNFDLINKRLVDVYKRLGGMDKRLDGLDGRLSHMDERADKRFSTLEKTVSTRILPKLLDLDDYVTEHVATKKDLADTREEMIGHIQSFAKAQNDFSQEQMASCTRTERLEKRVGNIERRIGTA
jgi:DNA anti-recombination protein RmuC